MTTDTNRQQSIFVYAKKSYNELKNSGKKEFPARMCVLIHFKEYYDDFDGLLTKVNACDKNPLRHEINDKKLDSMIKDFDKIGLIELKSTKRAGRSTPTYKLLMNFYETETGHHPINETFEEKFDRIFLQSLYEERSQAGLASFQEAYNYKRTYSWKEENKEEGLAYAIHDALAGYPDMKFIPKDFLEYYSTKHVNEEFRDSMIKALESRKKEIIINDFKHYVKVVHGINPEKISRQELEHEILSGLTYYGFRKEVGLSMDPLH